MKLGFIGLGIMGHPWRANLKAAGHDLFVPEHAQPHRKALRDAGAVACASPMKRSQRADAIITMVPDTPGRGEGAVRRQRRRGGSPNGKSRRHELDLADRDQGLCQAASTNRCDHLDAPVSGGEVGATGSQPGPSWSVAPAAFDCVRCRCCN